MDSIHTMQQHTPRVHHVCAHSKCFSLRLHLIHAKEGEFFRKHDILLKRGKQIENLLMLDSSKTQPMRLLRVQNTLDAWERH